MTNAERQSLSFAESDTLAASIQSMRSIDTEISLVLSEPNVHSINIDELERERKINLRLLEAAMAEHALNQSVQIAA
jgi:hypothetical protein